MRYHFIDKIERLEIGKEIRAIKCVTATEDYFQDHFVGFPVMPGALQIEALAQVCGALVEISSNYEVFSILLMVEKMKFKRTVHPADRLVMSAKMVSQHPESALLDVKIEVDNKIVTVGTIMIGIVSPQTTSGLNYQKVTQNLQEYFSFLLRDAEIIES